jgi:hypothetical protein
MKVAGIVVGVLFLIIGGVAGALFLGYQSMHDTAITFENDIKALNTKSENVLSTTTIKIQDAVGLNKQYTNSLKEVVQAAVEGRYGKNGSQATMQWIQEQNPTVDSKLFLKVHDIIDGGGSEFKISQDRKIELCTQYETTRDYLVRGWLLKMAGFPKKDVLTMCRIVSDEATQNAFATGKREATIK